MNNEFKELKALIDRIQIVYKEMTDKWLLCNDVKINLRQKQVCDIDEGNDIHKNIIDYVQFLNENFVDITSNISDQCPLKVESRVKYQNSIEYKIENYKQKRHEAGKVPINKCINDLFGIRVTLNMPSSFDEITVFMSETYGKKYKCIDSSKGDYKAVHVYFKENNNVYPWELQIWNACDRKENVSSHRKYKQEYTTWEKESKEGGIIND